MPPKQSTNAPRAHGRPSKTSLGSSTTSRAPKTSSGVTGSKSRSKNADNDLDPFANENDDDGGPSVPRRRRREEDMDVNEQEREEEQEKDEDEDEEEAQKAIPPELLTRLLHEFFEKDGTRISKDANKAVAKYMDIFVREAIARTAVEKESGFLEVEDLEKVAPQLLLDL